MALSKPLFPYRITLYVLLPVVVAGLAFSAVIMRSLTPSLATHLEKSVYSNLALASQMGLEVCEENLDELLSLRMTEDEMMTATMRKDALERIEAISALFPNIDLVVVEEGREVVGWSTDEPPPAADLADLPRKMPEAMEWIVSGRRMLIHARYFPFWRWHIVSLGRRADLLAPEVMAKRTIYISIFGTFAFLVAVFLIVFHTAVNRPLGRLIASTREVARGRFPRLATGRTDEIGHVIEAFNTMVGSLEEDQRRIEQALAGLKDSEKRFRRIFELAAVGIAHLNPDGRFIMVNRKFGDIFGYSQARMLEMTYGDITHPDFQGRLEQALRQDADTFEMEMMCRHAQGKAVWISLFYSVVRDEHGTPRYAVAAALDVTQRRQAAEALAASEERYRRLYEEARSADEVYQSLIQSSADPVVIYDLEGRVLRISPAFTATFGFEEDEIRGGRLDFVPESEKEETSRRIRNLFDGESAVTGFETRRFTKDGRVLDISISASRYYDHEGKPAGMLVFLRDTTEKKVMERQLQQAMKMEAVGNLAGGIAHDFNNVLQAINGYAQILLFNRREGDSGYHELSQILSAGDRASKLVRQLLTFSRRAEAQMRPLNINQEIIQMEKMLRPTIPRMIGIEVRLAEGLWTVNADPVQIEQVLLNLGGNAADAMPGGGTLLVETRNVVLSEEYSRDHLDASPGRYVLMQVSDTGSGIDKETMEHIFEPFYTTKETGKGTGLGLASVYGVVKNHGGHIACYSEMGQGTVFKVYLPAAEQAPVDLADVTPDETRPRRFGNDFGGGR